MAVPLLYAAACSRGTPVQAWPPPKRAPLPPLPPGQYDRVLPFTPPTQPDKLFYRGGFCDVRVPGLPLLPGMAGYTVSPWNQNQPPFCPPIMAIDTPRYGDPERAMILQAHADRGYTHFQLSIGHAMEQGLSIEDYVRFAQQVQAAGFFADHWFLGGGNFNARDMDAAYWRPLCQPWIDALLSAGAIDCACVGWQLDGYNTGTPRMVDGRMQSPIQSIIDYLAGQLVPHGIPLGTHWLNEAGAWNDPFDRFRWWQDQRGKLSWFHHQGDVNLDIPTYQAKLCDTLNPFGNGRMGTSGLFSDRPYGLVVFECSAQAQFDLHMSEDIGDQRGYLLSCTKAASHVSGYGNGARLISGVVL